VRSMGREELNISHSYGAYQVFKDVTWCRLYGLELVGEQGDMCIAGVLMGMCTKWSFSQ